MAKTEFKPKLTTIRPNENRVNKGEENSKAAKVNKAADGYAAASADKYKSLLGGSSAKAAELADLSSVINATPRNRRPSDPIQDILGSMLMGESAMATGPNVFEHEMPHVPDLEGELFREDPERIYNMLPVVQRYAALEKTIQELLWSNEAQLHPRYMSRMGTDEIDTLKVYGEALVNALRECRDELNLARTYYDWQLQDEKAAAAEAKAEEEANKV
jgi:hypothetical protein